MSLMSCEKALDPSLSKANQDGNVEVDCWFDGEADKLCVMAFTPDGSRALSKVKTGAAGVPVVLDLPVGDYVLVAVAHSSAATPSLKSPQQVVFNAKDGRKLTDTWCKAMAYTVEHDQPVHTEMTLSHATACVQFHLDDELPEAEHFAQSHIKHGLSLERCVDNSQDLGRLGSYRVEVMGNYGVVVDAVPFGKLILLPAVDNLDLSFHYIDELFTLVG